MFTHFFQNLTKLLLTLAISAVITSSVQITTAQNSSEIFIDYKEYVNVLGLRQAIEQELERNSAQLLPGNKYVITSGRSEEDWYLLSIASLDGPGCSTEYVGAAHCGGLLLARRQESVWEVALMDTDRFTMLINSAPETFISVEAKNLLIPQTRSTSSSTQFKFPWASGVSWEYWVGWHTTPLGLDIGTRGNGDNRVLAAADGVITNICNIGTHSHNVTINHNGISLGYLHIERGRLSPGIQEGTAVKRGTVLGTLKYGRFDFDGCGRAEQQDTSGHLHWVLPTNMTLIVDGWGISYPDNRWRKGTNEEKLPNQRPYHMLTSTNEPIYLQCYALSSSDRTVSQDDCVPPPPPSQEVKLYDRAYEGGNIVWRGGVGEYSGLGANSYRLEIPTGWSVWTYRENNFGGINRCWNESVPNLQDHSDWQNKIRSIKVYSSNVCPAPPPPSGGEWDAKYFNTRTCWDDHAHCNNPQHSEKIAVPGGSVLFDKDWGSNSPGGSVNRDNWTGHFKRTVNFSPGKYVFYANHDDGLILKFGNYGKHTKDSSGTNSKICYGSDGYSLSGDTPIELYLREDGGEARLKLWWSTDTSACLPTPTPTPTPTFTPTPTQTPTPTSTQTPSPPPADNTARVAAGTSHTCALTETNGVKCWGRNGDGQLGDGTTLDKGSPVGVVGLTSGVAVIAAGNAHTCALTTAGAVKCWGNNAYGQLGDGTISNRFTPINVTGLSSGVVTIATGNSHTCALTTTGGVKCWGLNTYGQLGNGASGNGTVSLTPVDVVGLSSGMARLTAGGSHTCALTTAGGIKCWGNNNTGQVGDGTQANSKTTPVDVTGLSSGIIAISAGNLYTCALTAAGSVKCWGSNNYGQLGTSTPRDIAGLSNGVVDIAAGYYHTCALTNAEGIKCWGHNSYGQIGNGAIENQSGLMTVSGLSSSVDRITAGAYHTCASTTAGGVICWGRNNHGQVGDGATGNKSTPGDVAGLTSDLMAVTTGGLHTCGLTAGGGVKCWGTNSNGQLGNGDTKDRITPIDVTGLSSGVAAISAGWLQTCALTSAGGVKCWGNNSSGQLGDDTTTGRSSPVNVVGLNSGVAAIAAGGEHTCALTTSGGVKCWGYANDFDPFGTENTLTPVDVVGLTSGVTAIAAGEFHTCALTASGGVKCWSGSDSPADVAGLTNGVVAIAAGDGHTCALTSAGGVKCWGSNHYGQLGDGTAVSKSTPVDVTGTSSGVTAIAGGRLHTCALTATSAKCWGRNEYGQLGDGTRTDRLTPVDVAGQHRGTAIEAGGAHTCLLTTAGGIKCWGSNESGQLGDGTAWRTTPVNVMVQPTITPTFTPTLIPSITATFTPTPTPISTPTPTHTPTATSGPVSVKPTAYRLSGKVYADTNGNGIQDQGESGIADARVLLQDRTGRTTPKEWSTYTDADGVYVFADIPQGQYRLGVELPPAYGYTDMEWEDISLDGNGSNVTISIPAAGNRSSIYLPMLQR